MRYEIRLTRYNKTRHHSAILEQPIHATMQHDDAGVLIALADQFTSPSPDDFRMAIVRDRRTAVWLACWFRDESDMYSWAARAPIRR